MPTAGLEGRTGSGRAELRERVAGGALQRLAERRVVEDHLDERLDRAVEHEIARPTWTSGRAFADAVATDQPSDSPPRVIGSGTGSRLTNKRVDRVS
jgi:hypothetical protein